MIITDSITIGQLTFILRVAIQILSYGGLTLIVLIVLANAPRVAPIDTHDVVNRIIGGSTSSSISVKWIFSRLSGRCNDPLPSTSLLIAISLFVSYAAVVAVSDIGFLGFYACSVPGPTQFDFPASVTSDEAALALIKANLVNGSDPSTIKAYRCDAVEVVNFRADLQAHKCTAWRNSTYADIALFYDINSTDTDALMPRQLTHHPNFTRAEFIDLNSYYLGHKGQRVTTATIEQGVALLPHDTGLRAVFGVPQLSRQQKTYLAKTMALEVDVGCMALGVYSLSEQEGWNDPDYFATEGDWRKYSGPDYLRDVLENTTDIIREYYRPFFNTSSLDPNGFMYGINKTVARLLMVAHVDRFSLPSLTESGLGPTGGREILGNCTEALQKQLGIPISKEADGRMCGLLEIGGSVGIDGTMFERLSRVVCATATQVSMVATTVAVDAEDRVSLNITHLPSDLNYLRADYWDRLKGGDHSDYVMFYYPYERFTLNDNPHSPTIHFIPHNTIHLGLFSPLGPGSGGNAFRLIGDTMLGNTFTWNNDIEYAGISLLEQGFEQYDINPTEVTRWAGQVGASFLSASLGYNGWAALNSTPIQVESTGGKAGVCYKPLYALGFVPLLLAALLVIVRACILSIRSSLFSLSPLWGAYGGMGPYKGVVYPGVPDKDILLAWEIAPEPHLQVVSKGRPVMRDAPETALRHLKTANPYPSS